MAGIPVRTIISRPFVGKLLKARTFMSLLIPHVSDMFSAEARPIPNIFERAIWKFDSALRAVLAICVISGFTQLSCQLPSHVSSQRRNSGELVTV